ncbi:hypothetical protein DOY81_003168 [Sarcophaga bullata]|nr:hypothetical protein DOY81_003168 [Sarcophaga bullata]
MSLGSSVGFKEVLNVLVGQEKLSLQGLLEYYRPLYDWLMEQNVKENNEIGWEKSDKCQS